MGKMFARLGSMYAWATPRYMLKKMSIQEIFMYYDYGIELEEHKSNILVNRLAVGLFGAKEPPKPVQRDYNDSLDKQAFYEKYGDKIKRPEGVKE